MNDLATAFALMDEGHNEEALRIATEAVASADPNGDELLKWLNLLGYIHCNLQCYRDALAVYDRYLFLARERDNKEQQHIALHQKAMVLRLEERYSDALKCIEDEADLLNRHFPTDALKHAINEYEQGYLRFLIDRTDEAKIRMEQSLTLALQTDDKIAQACAFRGLAEIARKQGKTDEENRCFDRARDLFLAAGDTVGAEEVNRLRENPTR